MHELNKIPVIVALSWLGAAAAPQQDTEPNTDLPIFGETLVTATRSPRAALDTPYAAEVIPAQRIERRAYRTTPQILRDTPGILVQETSHGQGSPYIRGFTGYRNLFLIDGVRLNNSVFRPGPNQYWNTVDPLSISRLEVVKGPSSVLYGSDAIGGTVNAITKSSRTLGREESAEATLSYRYASAEKSHVSRAAIDLSPDAATGLVLGLSVKSFGDVRGGSDTGSQPNTGYDEWDVDLKVERFLDPDTTLTFAYQSVRQDDVPRTHRTIFAVPFEGTTVGTDLKRDLDQERELLYVQIEGDRPDAFFERYRAGLSWQVQEETRDRIRGNGNPDEQGFDVGTLGLFFVLEAPTDAGHVTSGLDFYHDEVNSFSSRNPIQGPVADDARYDLLGVFLQDELEVTEDLTLTLGGRFNYAAADANSVFDPLTSGQTSLDEDWSSTVFSARFLYRAPGEALNFFGGISQGFRAPNLSDLTRFDSARTNEFEIPAPGLEAEDTTSFELGLKSVGESHSAQLALFYTDIKNQIIRFPTGNVNASGEAEITKANAGDGHVAGIELGAAYEVSEAWTLFGNATLQRGRVDTFPTSAPVLEEEYIDRLMPFTAQLGAGWEDADSDCWLEAVGRYADDADRLSTRDIADTSRIPPGGTPGYVVFSLSGGIRIHRNATLSLGLENITNEDYRIHGSGQNSAGRSLLVGVTVSL